MEAHIKTLMPKYDTGLKGNIVCVVSWASFSLDKTPSLLEKMTMIIQTWVIGSHFLENKQNEPVTSRKHWLESAANDKIWTLKKKISILEKCVSMP